MIPAPLLLVTDRSQLRLGRGLVPALAQCAAAGLTHVLLRELDLAPAQRAALSARVAQLGLQVVAARGPLPGAVGVHLAADQPVTAAGGLPYGRSCHTAAGVRRAASEGASWVTLSPFADSASKPGRRPLAPREYADAASAGVPVIALGGVTPANARRARDAGASGVAVMGGVMRAAHLRALVVDLLREVA